APRKAHAGAASASVPRCGARPRTRPWPRPQHRCGRKRPGYDGVSTPPRWRRQLAAITARHRSSNARVCGEWKNGTGPKRYHRGRKGVLKAMGTTKLKISAAFLVATVAVTGGRLLAQQALAAKAASPVTEAEAKSKPDSAELAQIEAKLAKLREVTKP